MPFCVLLFPLLCTKSTYLLLWLQATPAWHWSQATVVGVIGSQTQEITSLNMLLDGKKWNKAYWYTEEFQSFYKIKRSVNNLCYWMCDFLFNISLYVCVNVQKKLLYFENMYNCSFPVTEFLISQIVVSRLQVYSVKNYCSTVIYLIKTTMRYHFTLVRMAIIKMSTYNKWWRKCGEKWTLLHCWWKCKLVQPLWKTVWRFLRKLKIELPYDPAILLLGIYPEKTNSKRYMHPLCS